MDTETLSHAMANTASQRFIEELGSRTIGDSGLELCLQCGACSGACPFGYRMEFPPSRMIAHLRADQLDRVLRSESVWLCVSCFACAAVCPAKIP